jgi:formylglycine-generating enzyme required for sulfatase activity
VTCKCGRPSKRRNGDCHPCYVRQWKRDNPNGSKRKDPCVQQFFDWVRVCRQWAGEVTATERPLTRAEQEYLASLLCQAGYSDDTKGRVLGMRPVSAVKLVEQVRSGAVHVPDRDWQGLPV